MCRYAWPRRVSVAAVAVIVTVSAILPGAARCSERDWVLGPGPEVKVGQTAPNFNLTSIDGGKVELAMYRGRFVVLLDFWDIQCTACKAEMDQLKPLHDRYHDRGLRIISIDIEPSDTAAQISAFRTQYGGNWTWLMVEPDRSTWIAYGGMSIPLLVLIDDSGIVRYVKEGAVPASVLSVEVTNLIGGAPITGPATGPGQLGKALFAAIGSGIAVMVLVVIVVQRRKRARKRAVDSGLTKLGRGTG